MVVSINGYIDRVPSMDDISRRARALVWQSVTFVCWTSPVWLATVTGFLDPIQVRQAAKERRNRAAEGKEE